MHLAFWRSVVQSSGGIARDCIYLLLLLLLLRRLLLLLLLLLILVLLLLLLLLLLPIRIIPISIIITTTTTTTATIIVITITITLTLLKIDKQNNNPSEHTKALRTHTDSNKGFDAEKKDVNLAIVRGHELKQMTESYDVYTYIYTLTHTCAFMYVYT